MRDADARATGHAARLRVRSGEHTGHTSGMALGFAQGNVVILPAALAGDFLRFCQSNPKPCPVLAVSQPGDPNLPALGADLDIRTDVPRYRVFRNGELIDEPTNIGRAVAGRPRHFRARLLVLLRGGADRRWTRSAQREPGPQRCDVSNQRRHCIRGTVSRAARGVDAAIQAGRRHRAIQITTRFPAVHGAPVHIGLPEAIGIRDLAQPDYGDAVPVNADELPVFWACGVTPQAVIAETRPEFCITHAPGCMLITDLRNSRLAVL